MNREPEPIAARRRFYCAVLADSKKNAWPGELEEPTGENPANLVSSLLDDGKHAPVLDIDIPCEYIPSSTEGHGHLYFPSLRLEWHEYYALLKALADAGIIEPNYLKHSVTRGQTLVRLPGVKKEKATA